MNNNINLKICDEKHFFDLLEKCVEFRVPRQLRYILTLNSCNSAIALSRNIQQTIDEIELFMQKKFHRRMLKSNQKVDDYLGIFVAQQKDFQFLSGQKQMLHAIHKYCHKLYNIDDSTPILTPSDSVDATSSANVKDVASTSNSSAVASTSTSNDGPSVTQTIQSSSEHEQSNSLSNQGNSEISELVEKVALGRLSNFNFNQTVIF